MYLLTTRRQQYRPVYIYIYIFAHSTPRKRLHTPQEELEHIATPHTKQQTRGMPTTRGSSSSVVSAVATSGSEQQENPVMDVDPPPQNEPIDVDEDKSQA